MDINFRGAYDSTQSYVVKDVVSYTQNSTMKFFFCLSPNDSVNSHAPDFNSDNSFWGVINTSSNFPQKVDTFPFRVNIQGNDKVDIARINELTLKTSLTTSEQDELNNLIAKHRNKLFLADDLNAIQDSLSNLQMFFKDKIDPKLTQNVADIQSVRDEALNELDTKKASLDLYLDSTIAGALRTDLGVMTDLTTYEKSSLVKALNEIKTNAQMYKLTQDNGRIIPLVNATDLNTVTDAGIYYANSTTTNNPYGNNVVLEVFSYASSPTLMQRATAMQTTNPRVWVRYCSAGVWGNWSEIPLRSYIDNYGLGLSVSRMATDLNNEVNNGWVQFDTATINTPPTMTYGSVLTISRSTGRSSQIAINPSGGIAVGMAIRIQGSSGWGSWEPVVTATQESWKTATLLNGWTSYSTLTAGYYKDQMGRVHLKGYIQAGTKTNGTVLFTLPTGYRPLQSVYFDFSNDVNPIRLYITGNGNVMLNANYAGTFIALDNISFRAEQ